MKRYFIEMNHQNIHITEWGEIESPVVVCLHGLGSTGLSFLDIGERLKDHFRLIAIGAPGHGKSEPFQTAKEYEMPHLVDWVHGVIEHLGVKDFYLLTHSWGSFLALHYLVKYPERVMDTFLIDGGYQTKHRWSDSMEEEMDYYEKDFDEYVFDSWESFYETEKENYLTWTPIKKIAVKDLGIEQENKVHWHASGETARHIIRGMHLNETEDIYHLLPKEITLFVATIPERLSTLRMETAEIFKQQAAGRIIPVENTTHLLHWDRPDVIVEEILSKWVIKK